MGFYGFLGLSSDYISVSSVDVERVILAHQCTAYEHPGRHCRHRGYNFMVKGRPAADLLCGHTEAILSALQDQKHALESLTYAVHGSNSTNVQLPSDCRGFAEFTKLRHVTLGGRCPYLEASLRSKSTAPPGLISLNAQGISI